MPASGWRRRFFVIIFEADTPAGRAFDLALLVLILASVAVVMLDSLNLMSTRVGTFLGGLEWLFTALFTAEYLARLWCVDRPARYARSFFGIVDLLAVLPAYLAFLVPGLNALIDVRILRLFRVFRILKLTAYIREYRILGRALRASARKILIFITTVGMMVVLLGTVMYVIEGPENGYTSIPISIYWAITTITTVGFGDITPRTDLGRGIASFMMLLGWGILAVPTGIVTAEMAAERFGQAPASRDDRRCESCAAGGHAPAAKYCQECGAPLPPVS
ncbi:MAG: ion transporter [Chromatiales bacterium]|nr:ion transporter [Chromatiales bacterium]